MILPFNLRPTLSTYLYAAYPLGILEKKTVPDAVLNWNMQMAFQNRDGEPGTLKMTLYPEMSFTQYAKLGLFESRLHVQGRIPVAMASQLADEMVKLIGEGNYLLVYADYFYINGTPFCGQVHFRHEVLIHGFDLKAKTFMGVLYTAGWVLSVVHIPFARLVEAFVSPFARDRPESAYCREDLLACYKPRPRVAAAQGLNPSAIRTQIRWFLDEEHMFSDRAFVRRIRNDGVAAHEFSDKASFGRKVYPCLVSYFEQRQRYNSCNFDLRLTRLLYEHKRLMHIRLKRLNESKIINCQDLLTRWREVEERAKGIHVRAVTVRERSDASLLAGLPLEFEKLDSLETQVLKEFLKQGGAGHR